MKAKCVTSFASAAAGRGAHCRVVDPGRQDGGGGREGNNVSDGGLRLSGISDCKRYAAGEAQRVSQELLDLVKGKSMSIIIENKKATINPTWLIGGPLIVGVYQESSDHNGWGLIKVIDDPQKRTVHQLFINDTKRGEKVFNKNGRPGNHFDRTPIGRR